ncbi:MAG: hypothetical protein WDN28_06080 [Chthoniobacter sp.]
MPDVFIDITIQGLDEAQSYQRSGGFWEKAFCLSAIPPGEWIEIFDQSWDDVDFFPKRHARIEQNRLIFVCLEEEAIGYQMDELTGTIGRTNITYRQQYPA